LSKKPADNAAPRTKTSGRYRKVEVRTWGDAKFRQLSPIPPCGQGLWLFLITGPHTGPIPGLFRAGRAAMAEELGWGMEAFDKAFGEAFRQGMVEADFTARVMWVPRAISHNKPESPNVVRSWAAEFDLIPECDLKWRAFEALKASIHALGEAYGKAFDETFAKPSGKPSPKTSPNQEQEQEQDIEPPLPPKGDGAGDASPAKPGDDDPLFVAFYAAYPRKTGRADAWKAWRALKATPALLHEILAGLAKWQVHERWTKDGGRFIKTPGPWLRGRLWEDEEVCGGTAPGIPATVPEWVTKAGFDNEAHAANLRCYAHNADQFRDGKRIPAEAAA
jgi:hypothetical protein